ncbi:MAG: tRNA threonylcarbamoyladenosine dehydratase [Bacteroidales bacterium]|nr:tRNA threonylcarbamoyladenosine dehydratase [Bacteroidales bacterium]
MGHSEKESALFARTALLLGPQAMEKLSSARVIVFGIGGVGSWCVESLLRSGIKHITLVDADDISLSNVNRQLMATARNIGQVKVDVMRKRLLEIDPDAEIIARNEVYTAESAKDFDLDSYDYVLDCIDSLKDKISLIINATASSATFFSSLGSALKIDPCKIKVAEFWKVRGCPLGSMLRKRIRQSGILPSKDFLCVYDEEVLPNKGQAPSPDEDPGLFKKAQVNGTLSHITGIFGLTLAGLVIKDITER